MQRLRCTTPTLMFELPLRAPPPWPLPEQLRSMTWRRRRPARLWPKWCRFKECYEPAAARVEEDQASALFRLFSLGRLGRERCTDAQ